VKFLVDNQLPSALARWIESRGRYARHVLEIGMADATDIDIFRYAVSEEHILVSKDEDFLHLALRPGVTAGLIWVRIGNCRKQQLLDAFERAWHKSWRG
jgi:predicted nuclease of predicted toxin-antitoxin system